MTERLGNPEQLIGASCHEVIGQDGQCSEGFDKRKESNVKGDCYY